jgi:hypothetical protein
MKLLTALIFCVLTTNILFGQVNTTPSQTKIMTLGVFHFDYPDLDVVTVDKKDRISVFEEPYQSEIIAVSQALRAFNPTIIAVEQIPANQYKIDSLYALYKAGKWELKKNEIYQLGFRIGKSLNLSQIHCVDDPGKHYEKIDSLFKDSTRLSKLEYYYFNSPDTIYPPDKASAKVTSIIDALYEGNNPERIRERLSNYLLNPFKYEEQPGDFTGVDFETGRWYNRNLRIFRNIQRIPYSAEDRILLILGTEHLNLLNLFFDVSAEFELISPLPYLENILN